MLVGSTFVSITLLGLLALGAPACAQVPEGAAVPEGPLPGRLGHLIESLSERGGYFDTDNLLSNESSYSDAVARLRPLGGVYIGVGPEQNFHYIARLRPSWAFIVDVRRDNMLQHLLLNAVLDGAPTPFEYLCLLFSRLSCDASRVEPSAGVEAGLRALALTSSDVATFESNLSRFFEHIEGRLGVALSDGDRQRIRGMYRAFFDQQLDLRFRSHGRPSRRHYPSYRELLLARSEDGKRGNFLATREGYRYVRHLAQSGRLVPVVGDLAGTHALRAVGRFVESHGETVTALYSSNVEFYLLRSTAFDSFVANLRSLPRSEDSLLIRSYFDYGMRHPQGRPGHRSTIVRQRADSFLRLYDAGVYHSYWDVCTRDYLD